MKIMRHCLSALEGFTQTTNPSSDVAAGLSDCSGKFLSFYSVEMLGEHLSPPVKNRFQDGLLRNKILNWRRAGQFLHGFLLRKACTQKANFYMEPFRQSANLAADKHFRLPA